MQMSDVYSIWSATNTVQMMSEHTRDVAEIKKHLGLGQKARFWYGHLPKHEKEDAYRDMHLGILIKLHKQFTMLHKYASKDTPEGAQQLLQRIQHIDHIVEEIDRLLPQLPGHKDMGLSEGDKARFVTASKHARNFTQQQLHNIIGLGEVSPS